MKRFSFVVLFCLIPLVSFSQVQIDGSFVSDYVWRGMNVLDQAPAFQPSVTYSVGETGLGANIWGSLVLTRRGEAAIRELDEMDLTLFYDRSFGAVDLSTGFAYYNWFQLEDWPDSKTTTYEAYIGFTLSEVVLTPSLTVYYDLNKDGGDGMYLSFAVGKTIESYSTPLNISLSLGYMDQSYIVDAGISDINLGISTTIESDFLSYTPFFTFTYVPDDQLYAHGLMIWGGMAFTWVN